MASNLGITLLPEMVRHHVGQRIAMVRIQPPTPRRTVVATWRPGRYLSTNARQFLRCAEKGGRYLAERVEQRLNRYFRSTSKRTSR